MPNGRQNWKRRRERDPTELERTLDHEFSTSFTIPKSVRGGRVDPEKQRFVGARKRNRPVTLPSISIIDDTIRVR